MDADASSAAAPSLSDERDAERALERFAQAHEQLRREIAKVVVGQEEVVEQVLTCVFCDGHALLEGAPGLGKTLLVRTLAQALQLRFSRIQFTPDLMPADITGTAVVVEEGQGKTFHFRPGPVFAQIVLADEINRATPKTQSALLEAMQERSVTVEGATRPLPRPFFVLATQNPIEQEGTYPLPEAQLDRFFFKILVDYVGREALSEILRRTTTGSAPSVAAVLDAKAVEAQQQLVRSAAIAEHVQDYAVRLTLATQPASPFASPLTQRFVRFGASPRAAQALVLAAKCRALTQGRPAASIEDVRWAAPAALRHRVLINFEGQAEGVSPDDVVENLLATLPVKAEG